MRVLVVVHGFPPAAQGGSEIYAYDHARALQRLGDEVTVLTREQDPWCPEYALRHETRDGLRIAWVNNTFRETLRFADTYNNPAISAVADRVIDEFAPDAALIHHLTCLSTGIVRSLAARRIPAVLTLHDYWLMCHRGQLLDVTYQVCEGPGTTGCRDCLGPAAGAGAVASLGAKATAGLAHHAPAALVSRVRRAALALAPVWSDVRAADDEARARVAHMREVCDAVTRFIAPSRCMRDRFVAFGISPSRITLSPYGVDHAPFRNFPHTTASLLRIGFLGSLMPSKAPHVLLDAFARLPDGLASVDLFGAVVPYHGDDSYQHTLAPLLRQPGVTHHGPIAHEDVAPALSAIDVLVVPSIWPENSPLVIREAFLAGVPVVASRIGGIPEVVEQGRGGLLFPAGDAGALAGILTRLASDRARLDELRAGIPAVRTIEDDAQAVRGLLAAPARRPVKTAAVVLHFRSRDDTFLAVRSLAAVEPPLSSVIVVNNGAETALDLGPMPGPAITLIHTGQNLGFSGGMNVGIREALARGADRLLLVNSDVVVPADTVARLEAALDLTPSAGVAGPVVRSRSHPDVIASFGMSYSATTGRMRLRFAGERFAPEGPAVSVVDGVAGCLMLVTSEMLDAAGWLDEDYFYAFEDLDLCLRAKRAGYLTVVAGSAVAYHEGGRSIGAESPSRLYFASRNHLLLAHRLGSGNRIVALARTASIVGLNVAYALKARPGSSRAARLLAVARGVRDYLAGRVGAGSESRRLSADLT